MSSEPDNKKKLESFFDDEYLSLKSYVGSRIRATTDRDAEDIIQDVALNLFAGAERYGPINNIAGFVYRSVKNKIVDIMRKSKNKSADSEEIEEKWMEFAALMYGQSDNTYSIEMMGLLKDSINNLNPAYRSIIVAVDFEGYTYREIAEETRTPEGTLMSRRHRAIAQLYKALKDKKHNTN